MSDGGHADAGRWRQQTGVEAVLYWCVGSAVLAALLIGWRTHRTLGYPRYRYEAEHLDLGRPLGGR